MLVKLKENLDSIIEPLNGLSKNKKYFVVEISNEVLRVVNNNFEPTLYPMDAFDVIEKDLGNDWIVDLCPDNEFYITSKALSEKYFFGKLFDYDEECVAIWRKYLVDNGIRNH